MNDRSEIGLAYGVFAMFYIAIVGALALWTERNIEFWAGTDVPYWLCFLLSIFGPFIFLGNLISEIARVVVGGWHASIIQYTTDLYSETHGPWKRREAIC